MPPADAPWRLSAVAMAEAIRRGELSSEDAVASVLDRVAAHNPRLNAIVSDLSDTARAQAVVADRARQAAARGGGALGALHGVPVTVKENVDQEGEPTPNGMAALADVIAPADSPVVRNLRLAGAIIIGRTNTPELSMRATTDNPLHGRTRNPWDEDASPGGSSGGAGAAAAAGFGPLHHGNDIGGSLRYPSFCCGLATVKPTLGRVPAYNPSQTAERGLLAQLMSVQGVVCREVRDVRLGLEVLAQGDARDPWWVPAPLYDWPEEPRPRIAVTQHSYGYPVHPEILAAVDRAAGLLSDAGYDVSAVDTPDMSRPFRGWFDVAVHELEATLGPLARERGSPLLGQIFDAYGAIGEPVDADGYRDGVAARTALTREWNLFLADYPLLLSPLLMQPAYDWDADAGTPDAVRDLFTSALYAVGVNYLSLPAGVVPTGLVAGRPAGVQLIGRRYREDQILDAMQVIEAGVGVLTQRLWERMG